MKYYLVVYDTKDANRLELTEFDDAEAALEARFARERAFRDRPGIEVSVLLAPSVEALKQSHPRYFRSLSELVREAREEIAT